MKGVIKSFKDAYEFVNQNVERPHLGHPVQPGPNSQGVNPPPVKLFDMFDLRTYQGVRGLQCTTMNAQAINRWLNQMAPRIRSDYTKPAMMRCVAIICHQILALSPDKVCGLFLLNV
jgi:hypothetical protein